MTKIAYPFVLVVPDGALISRDERLTGEFVTWSSACTSLMMG